MRTTIPVENGDTLAALQGFLRRLLEAGVVEALLVPLRTPHGAVAPALVTDPARLAAADPLAPVLPVNGAALAGQLSLRPPRPRVAAVLRPCELRALVELIKLQQAGREDLTLIALDCAGTYDAADFRAQGAALWPALYRTAATQPDSPDPGLRPACRMCAHPVFEGADITLELLGSDLEAAIFVSLPDELGERLGFEAAAGNGRPDVVNRLVAAREGARAAELAAIRARLAAEGLTGVLDACLRCHNCMVACPICYCKTCVFRSAVFDHEPLQYLAWARQKGACRLPADAGLFHLTRLNHMGLSCVGCGLCSQACPVDLPVGPVFQAIGGQLQETFGYVPGRDPAEPLPLVTFKEDEWIELGEG